MGNPHLITAALLLVGALFLLSGCGSETAPEDAPEGHTTMKDGVPHAPGLNNPNTSCTACHGDTLRGGDNGEPSCYSCHGQEW